MKKRELPDAIEKDLSRCFFCQSSEGIERRTPAGMTGIYARCKICGAVGGIEIMKSTRHGDRLCRFWTCGEDAPYREAKEPAAAAVTEAAVISKGVIA